MKRLVLLVIMLAGLISVSACKWPWSGDSVAPTSDLPTIELSVSPSSGRAPLTVEIAIDVTNGTHCQLVMIAGGVEGKADDIACVQKLNRTVSTNTGFRVSATGPTGKKVSRTEFASITP